jgi:hypothetical protein
LRVTEDPALTTLVDIDECGMIASPAVNVLIERVVGEIRLRADEPAKCWIGPLEDAIPGSKPRQLARCLGPEGLRIAEAAVEPLLNNGGHHTHTRLP